MDLYFTEGADLSNEAVLVQAAADVGLDPEDVRAALDSDKDIAEIEQEVNAAKEAGIQGVPCFILDGKYAISGAQEPEALAQAIQQVSAQAAE
jgi:predicted DsbA family dithiol-disulfide isomerase